MDADEDWLVRFLHEFASMSEKERDAAIDALTPQGRDAIVTLAEQRAAIAGADLIEVLDAGQHGLDGLYEVIQPADLLTVIKLAATENPDLLVEALFATVILHRRADEKEPAVIAALREQWHWHVYEQIGPRQPEDDGQKGGA